MNSYLPFQFETLFNLSNNLAPNLLTLLYFTLMKFPENSCGKWLFLREYNSLEWSWGESVIFGAGYRLLKDHEGSWSILKDLDGSWKILIYLERSWWVLMDLDALWWILMDLEGFCRILDGLGSCRTGKLNWGFISHKGVWVTESVSVWLTGPDLERLAPLKTWLTHLFTD